MSAVLIAPFSNSDIRDWPAEHFAALIGLLLPRLPDDVLIRVVGTPSQRISADQIVRHHPSQRVRNDCGRLPWAGLLVEIKRAACMIGNNSGLSHLSGYFGTPTVCIFGGSHQRTEWGTLGENIMILSRVIGCSPCQLDHKASSPYGKTCLRQIAPIEALKAVSMVSPGLLSSEADKTPYDQQMAGE